MPYYGGEAQRADPKFLIERLMRNGYTRMQAAAIVGNLRQESGLASNNMNKAEGAYGLMQWRGPRFDQLQNFAAKQGVPWTDPGAQADFIAHEMRTTEKGNAGAFLGAKTIDEASAALHPVIRYGDQSGPQRALFARNAFGASDAAPGIAAPPDTAPQPPPAAPPAVSRETSAAYAPPAARGRGLRGGLTSLGEGLSAQLEGRAQMPSGLARLGGALSGAAASLGAQPVPGRTELAGTIAGPPPAMAPPGAPEPPMFPGGAPQPRQRPMTGPGLPAGAPLVPNRTVAGMGSLVDPLAEYDYYG